MNKSTLLTKFRKYLIRFEKMKKQLLTIACSVEKKFDKYESDVIDSLITSHGWETDIEDYEVFVEYAFSRYLGVDYLEFVSRASDFYLSFDSLNQQFIAMEGALEILTKAVEDLKEV